MADFSNSQTALSDGAISALTWFRDVFVKSFAQGQITKKGLKKIVEKDKEFLAQLFRLLDTDQNGALCYQEFVGGLLRLGRGKKVSDKSLTRVAMAFIVRAGASGELREDGFITMCLDAKILDYMIYLFDVDKSGAVDVKEFLVGIDKLARTNTDIKWYSWAEKWFLRNASRQGNITKEQFLSYLNISKSSFADRVFRVADSNNSDSVELTELMHVLYVLTQGSANERLLLLFNMYDIDGNGHLDYSEVTAVLQWCLSDSSLSKKSNLVGQLTDVLFQKMDTDDSGDISLAEFEMFLNQYPNLAENLTISFSKSLHPRNTANAETGGTFQRGIGHAVSLVSNNLPIVWFWLSYLAVNTALFITAAQHYWNKDNISVVLARGAGQCLNFNSAFIVVLMFRNIMTFARSTKLRKYIPLDHHVNAHRIVGVLIVIFSILHTTMHVTNTGILSLKTNTTWGEYLLTFQDGWGWVGGSACITGWILILLLAVIAGPSLACARGRGYFQVFYWTHWLFIVWWIVLVIHARNFWKWVIGPAVVLALEKLLRHVRSTERRVTRIWSIRPVDSKVSEVVIERPKRFKFNAGDFVFINIQEIAKFEWHPFTISSAPEQSDFITLHIEARGDWTNRLRELGDTMCPEICVLSQEYDQQVIKTNSRDSPFQTPSGVNRTNGLPMCFSNIAFQSELGDEIGQNYEHMVNNNAEYPLNSSEKNEPASLLLTRTLSTSHSPGTRIPSTSSSNNNNDSNNNQNNSKVKVELDGPYGTPSTSVYYADHAILISAGIGVTPFASILQSIAHRRKLQRAICPNCRHWWKIPGSSSFAKCPRKVDFIWITRNFDSQEWFLDVLSELEEEQVLLGPGEDFLNIRLHVTSALVESDIRAVALQMALKLYHRDQSRDPLCGLRTRIKPGRPNWKQVFDNIISTTNSRKSVFYCGPPSLERELRKLCNEYDLRFTSENF